MSIDRDKLSLITKEINLYNKSSDDEVSQITTIYVYLSETYSKLPDGNFLFDHALGVTRLVLSWKLDLAAVKAAMLHDILIRKYDSPEPLSNIAGSDTISILENFGKIQASIKNLEDMNIQEENITEIFEYSDQEAFYIKIAERIDILSKYINSNNEEAISVARKTREILIPLVKRINAYKIVDILESLCFQAENYDFYSAITDQVCRCKEMRGHCMQQFCQKMNHIFNPASNIIPEDLKKYQSYIKNFLCEERSVISLQRFITNNKFDERSWEKALANIHSRQTALYDMTLIIDDSCSGPEKTVVDIFMEYYKTMLEPEKIYLYGYFPTTYKDTCFFLLYDNMNNSYRFFVRYESSYNSYLYGNIAGSYYPDIYDKNDITEKIRVFRKDGKIEQIKAGASVLDFAFLIQPDLGLHFSSARVNNTKNFPPHTILNNGDTVEIFRDKKITASLNWFRYLKTDKAINELIKYFRRKNGDLENSDDIKILTKDGSIATLPKGATVLDYAFSIDKNTGLHCSYALINRAGVHYPIDHVLNNGDQVLIRTSPHVSPDFYWFRHAKTEKTTEYLIQYFKRPAAKSAADSPSRTSIS